MRGVRAPFSILLFFMVLALGGAKPRVPLGACDASDKVIHKEKGKTFPVEFRKLGGFSVSKSAYEDAIVEKFALSPACASCFGDAYICGWSLCRWKCVLPGLICDACLIAANCISECNKCTGF